MKNTIGICIMFLLMVSVPNSSAGNDRIAEGLKEALNVGIKAAVQQLGVEDGYYKNSVVKILMPEKLQKADQLIKDIGAGEISEVLVLQMNRAAEQAAPQTLDIFLSAVKGINIIDAAKLLSGESESATVFLQNNTTDSLKSAILPIVQGTMEEVGAIKTFNEYMEKLKASSIVQTGSQLGSLAKASGLIKSETTSELLDMNFDINQYVTDKAVEGLFITLAAEEQKIRENPEARVTDILKDVFGGLLSR